MGMEFLGGFNFPHTCPLVFGYNSAMILHGEYGDKPLVSYVSVRYSASPSLRATPDFHQQTERTRMEDSGGVILSLMKKKPCAKEGHLLLGDLG
jgi:hypothetical protein